VSHAGDHLRCALVTILVMIEHGKLHERNPRPSVVSSHFDGSRQIFCRTISYCLHKHMKLHTTLLAMRVDMSNVATSDQVKLSRI
jgi:hypothetical protein